MDTTTIIMHRKRSLAWIGLLFSSYGPVEASVFPQHVVPPARRRVLYQSSSFSAAKGAPSAMSDKPPDGVHRQLHYVQNGNEWLVHVHADAQLDHPDVAFARARRLRTAPKLPPPDTATGHPLQPAPRQLQKSEFATNFVHHNESQPIHDFNVTATTEYNVSSNVVNATAPTSPHANTPPANDTSTVLYTTTMETNATTVVSSTDDDSIPTLLVELDHNATTTTVNGTSVLYQPLRMRAFLSEQGGGGEHLNETEHAWLLQEMVRPALLSWSAALRIDPVAHVRLEHNGGAGGESFANHTWYKPYNLTVDMAQLVDGQTCGPGMDSGLPSVPVPAAHLTEGVADTDLIIYIAVAFMTNNTIRHPEDDSATLPPQSAMGEVDNATVTTITPMLPKQTCAGDYLAASSFCSTDQLDRPTAALLHICIDADFFATSRLQRNIMTIMHELGHVLGFNAVSLAHFRRPDGTPITARNADGAIPRQTIECTGPQGNRVVAHNVSLPAPSILQFKTVRGGVRAAEVVTPSVRQVVRNHFGCFTLSGAELESGEFLPLSTSHTPGAVSCIGDHWERRLFKNDLMNPIVDDTEFSPRIQTLTLAWFADSGWYQVDLSRASLSASWGRGAGCAFVNETCIDAHGQVPPSSVPFFCNDAPAFDSLGYANNIHGCTPDLSMKAACSMGQYDGSLPQPYQYFNYTYGANVGGSDPYMDYCPVYAGFVNGLCSDGQNEAVIRMDDVERFGRRNSRCLAGELVHGDNSDVPVTRTALCLPIACVVEDRSLRIQVDGHWKKCTAKDAALVSRNGNRIVCPDPIRICPTFYCTNDCLGTSKICDYKIGECVCPNITDPTLLAWNVSIDPDTCEPETNATITAPGSSTFCNAADKDDSHELPDQDSPLSDYYVPTARQLPREGMAIFTSPLKAGTMFSGIFLVLVGLGTLWIVRRKARRRASDDDDSLGFFWGPHDDGNMFVAASPINRDKHKMMATVVLDLRMDNPNLPRAYHDVLSETDQSWTDTEGGNSSRRGETGSIGGAPSSMSSLRGSSDDGSKCDHDAERSGGLDLYGDEVPPVQQVTRRRRLFLLR